MNSKIQNSDTYKNFQSRKLIVIGRAYALEWAPPFPKIRFTLNISLCAAWHYIIFLKKPRNCFGGSEMTY